MKKLLERNIIITYISSCLGWGRFFIPVLALFYIASQVSVEQYGIILGVFFLVILLLEIPSGVIADLIGRKNSIIIAKVMYVVEIYLFAFHDGFWIFLIAKIISGIGVSFDSGAGQALLFDSLKKLKREDEHKKITGIKEMIRNTSMAIVFIIGAYLFTIHYKLPAIVSLPFTIINLGLVFLYFEPYVNKRKLTFKNSYLQFKEGLIHFWNHGYIKYLAFLSLPLLAVVATLQSYSSLYLEQILIPIAFIGVIAFISSMISAYTSKKADAIEKQIGEKKSILLMQVVLVAAAFLMGLMIPVYGFLFYFIAAFLYGFCFIVINHYLNLHIESSHRATMLSIVHMFKSMGVFILMPTAGFLIREKSIQFTFWTLAIFAIIYFLVLHLLSKNLRLSKIQ
jgi:MFS family permease